MDQTIMNLKVNSEKILQETTVLRNESSTLRMALNELGNQMNYLNNFIGHLEIL